MSAPTSEYGHAGGYAPSGIPAGRGRQTYTVTSPADWAAELQFPESIVMYDVMRTETHLSSVLEAVLQPILTAHWRLDERGVPDDVMNLCATELGLHGVDAQSRVKHQGVRITEHLAEMASTMLWAGFSVAELVWNPGDPTPAQRELGFTDDVVHLRKLAPRPPRTITKIEVDRDGGLRNVHQKPMDVNGVTEDVVIPVDKLVFYSLNREGADWTGRSLLRNAYQSWALKDIFMRLDAQAVEKHSMGYWVARTTDPSRADAIYEAIADLRAGERAALVLQTGDEVELMGMTGSTVNVIDRLKYLDQAMSRSALAMFLDLGHDDGARALAETHLKVFQQKIQSVADYLGHIATEHIVRELVRWNFPEGTPYPSLLPGDIAAQQGVSAEVLNGLLDSGAVTWDRGLEDHTRTVYGLPPLPDDFERTKIPELNPPENPGSTIGMLPDAGPPASSAERTVAASAFERATAAYEALRARVNQ